MVTPVADSSAGVAGLSSSVSSVVSTLAAPAIAGRPSTASPHSAKRRRSLAALWAGVSWTGIDLLPLLQAHFLSPTYRSDSLNRPLKLVSIENYTCVRRAVAPLVS